MTKRKAKSKMSKWFRYRDSTGRYDMWLYDGGRFHGVLGAWESYPSRRPASATMSKRLDKVVGRIRRGKYGSRQTYRNHAHQAERDEWNRAGQPAIRETVWAPHGAPVLCWWTGLYRL